MSYLETEETQKKEQPKTKIFHVVKTKEWKWHTFTKVGNLEKGTTQQHPYKIKIYNNPTLTKHLLTDGTSINSMHSIPSTQQS